MAEAASELEIVAVPVLSDNYAWLVYDPKTQETVVVDPGEAQPVIDAAAERGWRIAQAWITHWHPDHTGGIGDLKRAMGTTVVGPKGEADRIEGLDVFLKPGDVVRIGGHTGAVLATPGHTSGHISFHFAEDAVLFTGDTLFAMGCGRLFEGTPAEMWDNMEFFAGMAGDTKVYAGHEYTASNARFAAHVKPKNREISDRRAAVEAMRARNEPTLPTTIAEERATNPFMRAGSAERLGELRAEKDAFRG